MTVAEKIILRALAEKTASEQGLQALKRSVFSDDKLKNAHLPTKTELLSAYHTLRKEQRITANKELEALLRRRGVRSRSGVAIVTSLVKPYPCPGQCVYCPLDERMPKSYLSEEPAAARALTLEFSPYNQMAKRIDALEANGHSADKIEFIVKGGTWNSYPLQYQYWFILESFRAANEAGKKILPSTLGEDSPLPQLKKALHKEQRKNETAKHRIIGLTLETRPDCINYFTLLTMREQGCTRLELGVQCTDDDILKLTKRGHDTECSRRATELARNIGFKVDFHLMPQLPGATPTSDLAMLERVFTDDGLKPDMIKIYPCTVIKNSELYEWFVQGKYKAYSVRELIDILKVFKSHIPRYCRISRLIRDIPGQYIEEGNTATNLRQVIAQEMARDGLACKCLRCRELGHVAIEQLRSQSAAELKPKLYIDEYATRGGTEYFLSFEDSRRRVVYAFCRLRILAPEAQLHSKLPKYDAYIRELHTYGVLVPVGGKKKKELTVAQHTGLGKKLVAAAEKIARQHTASTLAVISGVGVRGYYRSLGYRLSKTYMVKSL